MKIAYIMYPGACYMGNKETYLETLNKLSATKGISVVDTPVYGEHHHIEAVCYLANVL